MNSNISYTYLALFFAFLLCAGTASANEIYVGEGFGNSTISAALANATNGDTIVVTDGTYVENIDVDKEVTIISERGATNATVQASTSSDHIFNITVNNVTVSGFNITGSTFSNNAGVYLNNVLNCNISNNIIVDNNYGIFLSSSNNNTISNNLVTENSNSGISIVSSNNNTLRNNIVNNNQDSGIYIYLSNANSLINNTVGNNSDIGVSIQYSENTIMDNNTMSLNLYNFRLIGNDLGQYIHAISETNLVDGKPIYCWINRSDEQVPSDAGQVCVINSTNITVKDLTISKEYYGIVFAYTNNSTIENIVASEGYIGIDFFNSHSNVLNGNSIYNNADNGIEFAYSNNNTVSDNTVNSNEDGIKLDDSHGNSLINNVVCDNQRIGIDFDYSDDSRMIGNTVNNNAHYGIYGEDTYNSILISNTANENGAFGIYMDYSPNTTLLNNIANNNIGGSIERKSVNIDSISINKESREGISCGIYLYRCPNSSSVTDTTIGNFYGIAIERSENTTIDKLKFTDRSAKVSFAADANIIAIGENVTHSKDLSGKVNVNGYIDVTRLPLYLASVPLVEDNFTFKIHYDDSGMSRGGESSIGLYELINTEWTVLPDASLNTNGNYVTTTITQQYIIPHSVEINAEVEYTPFTLALFKDPEPSGSSVIAREISQGRSTDLPVGGDGEITGDTVVKSSNAATTLTLYKGTKAVDASGNPVNRIIVTTPSSLPSDTPAEVVESGLYFRFGPSGTTFSQDVMITMEFDPEDFEGRAPVIYTYTSEDGWIALETTVDWENGRATAMISHFSLYALFGTDGEEAPVIAAETQGKDTDVHVVQEEGTPVETEEGSGILFWVVGLVLVLGIGAAILMNRKKHGEL
ncbi:NosD domain-containing protein [Methanolobus sp.]|uniref:right-handed parallel beta-helix repeat-containing protein n=1 Tax=Methanolobus sp. TaxID=1874737 RepID=UPI0025E68455|nr:NosD domain-containing protein [Methanolobus sp.]